MAITVEVYKGKDKQWYWRAIASNGRKIANAGEGYKHRRHAINMIGRIFPTADLVVEDSK